MAAADRAFEGTTAQWYVFADFLRRALHAAVDQIEPQADGLEPIRAKIGADQALRGAKALLAAQDVGAARLLAELIGAAGLRAQDVGAAGLGAENVGAAGLRAKFISAAGLGTEDVGAVIRCHRDLLLAGFSHSLHHRGPAFIARPVGEPGNPGQETTDRSAAGKTSAAVAGHLPRSRRVTDLLWAV